MLVFVAVHGLSVVAANGGCLPVVPALLIAVASPVVEHRPQLPGSRAQAQELRHTGLVALQHVKSSGSGIKPVSPAFDTGLPGKPS